MLNRRYIRIKVMQLLYAFFQTPNSSIIELESKLKKSTNALHDLYLQFLYLLKAHYDLAQKHARSLNEQVYFASNRKDNVNVFLQISLIKNLSENEGLTNLFKQKNIANRLEEEQIEKSYIQFIESDLLKKYAANWQKKISDEKEFLRNYFDVFLANNDYLIDLLQEKNIFWSEDEIDFTLNFIAKTIRFSKIDQLHYVLQLGSVYKDASDESFASILLKKTIEKNLMYEELIAQKAENWDITRIALLDNVLIKMGICEIENIDGIPINASLNEYIEISKEFCTEKSKVFINGILDKIVVDFKSKGLLNSKL